MAQYEYHILDLEHGVEHRWEFEQLLNDLGAQGWLLVLQDHFQLIFVRPKPNPATKANLVWGKPQPIPERTT